MSTDLIGLTDGSGKPISPEPFLDTADIFFISELIQVKQQILQFIIGLLPIKGVYSHQIALAGLPLLRCIIHCND